MQTDLRYWLYDVQTMPKFVPQIRRLIVPNLDTDALV